MSAPAHVSLARKRKKQSEKLSFSCHASLYIAHLHTRAPGHSTASLPGHLDPQHEWDCAVHHCPTPLPKRTDQPGSTRTFLPVLLLIGLAVLEKAKKAGCWFDLTWHSNRAQGEGSPAHRQAVDVHTSWLSLRVGGERPGFVSSGRSWHHFPALATLHPILSVCICKATQTMLF